MMKTFGLLLLGLVVAAFAFIGILYSTRGTPLQTVRAFGDSAGPPAVGDSLFLATMELFTGEIHAGNHVEVMINGDQTYGRLFDDLRAARESITMQMYYCQPGKMAETFKTILMERAQAGVRILVLLDAFGAQNLSEEYVDSLSAAGVRVARFRPVHWYSLHKAQSRSHIRVVVVDGRVAWTGGFGIDDKWYGDGRSKDSWRDSNARFTGPVVLQHQATFAAGWVEATGELITGEVFFPLRNPPPGDGITAGLMHFSPTIGSTPAERFLALSIAGARKTLYITNSYFVPDDDFRLLLIAARKRGVDVRILTAGDETDIKTTLLAGRGHYQELLSQGIRVYEYQPTMMHAKTLVVDGMWSSVGTMNFDNRSLVFNDESNINVLDAAFGATMDSIFIEDLKYSKEIVLEQFRKRPWPQKVLEKGATALGRVL